MTNGLLGRLRQLELELHKLETRRDVKRMEFLLHPNFVEFARSGQQYSRDEVLREFSAGDEFPAVHAQNFELAEFGY